MNKIDTSKKQMFDLLELINEQTEMLKFHKGEIPQLYIDLLKKNVLKFYESIHTIDRTKKLEKEILNPEDHISKNLKEEKKKEDITAPKKPEIKKEFTKPIPEAIMPEVAHQPKPKPKQEAAIVIEEDKPTVDFTLNPKSEKPFQEKEIFIHPNSDLFTEAKPSVADKLSAKQDPTLGEKMQQNQINDIKSAIGINDKFLFINELFEGDLKNYNQAVDQLNLSNNKNEAMAIFRSFQEKFKWPEKDQAVLKLQSILNRKYSIS